MPSATYLARREQIETYFDRTAIDAWTRLASDAPLGRIRATVRAGRDTMRRTLLEWLPADLTGRRLLDAGCGAGALAMEAARRGADVVAVDLSPTLIELARERQAALAGAARVRFLVGDMLDPALGRFDHIVAMDSLIHYAPKDAARVLAGLGQRTSTSMIFTFAPRTPLLACMHALGRLFPRGNRAPAIEPVHPGRIERLISEEPGLEIWQPARGLRVARGFYISQAMELVAS